MTKIVSSISSLIDRKGKVFGVVHVFDALLILLGIFFLLVILKQVFQQKTWVVAEIKITPEQWWFDNFPPPRWLSLSLQKGDKEVDWKGSTAAEIIDTKNYDTGYDRIISYLKIKFLTRYDKKMHRYFYNNKVLNIGQSIELNFSKVTIKGIVVNIEGYQDRREKINKIVTLKLYDRRQWFADAVKVGDTMKVNNTTIAEIIEKDAQLAEKTTVNLDSNAGDRLMISRQDPLKRDITLKVRLLLTKEEDGGLMFRDDQRVIVGNDLFIALSQINLQYATIINIE